MPLRTHHFDCQCLTPEHSVRFVLYHGDINTNIAEPSLDMDFYLYDYDSFFKRAWAALKYALGYKQKCFGEVMFKPEDVKRLKRLSELYECYYQQYENLKRNK